MIRTQGLTRKFRTATVETTALDHLDLTIGQGEFVALMGPSGCGKSTLLNLLGLLDNPTSGDLFFLDQNVARLPERQRARLRKANIGFIFQTFNLIDDLTVYQNVELPLTYLKVPPAERRPRVEAALEKMQIAQRRDHYPRQLSGGQQQRVAIARTVVIRPQLILADEPTGNLDSARGAEVLGLLQQLHGEGATVVMVTHSQHDASHSQRIVHLLDGKLAPAAVA